jgi:SAM-dependent methyltransferase
MARSGADRVDRALLREVAAVVTDPSRRDEMAGPSYLHPIPFVRWLFWKRLDVVVEFLGGGRTRYGTGLDFGCGLGVLLPTLGRLTDQVYATDLALEPSQLLVAGLQLRNVRCVAPARLAEVVRPGSLDYVVATDVLEHVDDLERVVRMLGSALRPGGRWIVSGPTENRAYKMGRVLAGFGEKGGYHRTNIQAIHETILRHGGVRMDQRRILPAPPLIEAFHVYRYIKS